MKLFVLGKIGGVLHWTEDSIAGFRAAGHDVRLGVTRNPHMHHAIERLLLARWTGAPLAARLCRAIARFSPDMILVIAANLVPRAILEHVAAMPGRAPLVGWVGDRITADHGEPLGLFDAVAYTDSGLLRRHAQLGFLSRALFLPLAANPRLDRGPVANASRQRNMVFVANPTPHRLALAMQVRTPLWLYGPGWRHLPPSCHHVEARRIEVDELAALYRTHFAVLNVRNEQNVLDGLNQRHFDPYFAATPVVTDDQADLSHCFEPGREILVYQDVEALNDLYARLQREPELAAAVGEAGRRRVLAEHTYGQRLKALAEMM